DDRAGCCANWGHSRNGDGAGYRVTARVRDSGGDIRSGLNGSRSGQNDSTGCCADRSNS
ncbi:hypothetical protein CH063_12089, partial [Colletotrichum higginsianum]